jgi:hypothetical protein
MLKEDNEDEASDSEASQSDASETSDPKHPANQVDFPPELKWTDGWVGMCLDCCADGR